MSLNKFVLAVLSVAVVALAIPAASAIAADNADTLCVTDNGTLKARGRCQDDERPFRVVDGKLHESRLVARTADDGRNSANSDDKYATGGEFLAEESVETAARAFTKKWVLPEGWKGKIVDDCPDDMVPIAGNAYFPGHDPRFMPQGTSKMLGMPTVLIDSIDGGPTRDLVMFTTQVCAPRVELEATQG